MDGVACCTRGASRRDECMVRNHGPPRDKSRINECTGREGCIRKGNIAVFNAGDIRRVRHEFFTKRLHITLSLCPALRQALVNFLNYLPKKRHFVLITFLYFALSKYLMDLIQYFILAFLFFL